MDSKDSKSKKTPISIIKNIDDLNLSLIRCFSKKTGDRIYISSSYNNSPLILNFHFNEYEKINLLWGSKFSKMSKLSFSLSINPEDQRLNIYKNILEKHFNFSKKYINNDKIEFNSVLNNTLTDDQGFKKLIDVNDYGNIQLFLYGNFDKTLLNSNREFTLTNIILETEDKIEKVLNYKESIDYIENILPKLYDEKNKLKGSCKTLLIKPIVSIETSIALKNTANIDNTGIPYLSSNQYSPSIKLKSLYIKELDNQE